jgi:hypothetical protein
MKIEEGFPKIVIQFGEFARQNVPGDNNLATVNKILIDWLINTVLPKHEWMETEASVQSLLVLQWRREGDEGISMSPYTHYTCRFYLHDIGDQVVILT